MDDADMSKLLEHLKIEPTKRRSYDSFESVKAVVMKAEPHMELYDREQYSMRAIVGVEFSANRAQYEHAKMAAKRLLVQQLYGEVFASLAELEHAAYSGDREDVIKIISDLRTHLLDVE